MSLRPTLYAFSWPVLHAVIGCGNAEFVEATKTRIRRAYKENLALRVKAREAVQNIVMRGRDAQYGDEDEAFSIAMHELVQQSAAARAQHVDLLGAAGILAAPTVRPALRVLVGVLRLSVHRAGCGAEGHRRRGTRLARSARRSRRLVLGELISAAARAAGGGPRTRIRGRRAGARRRAGRSRGDSRARRSRCPRSRSR